ncbi:MAG: hypothetical protein ACK4YQ_12320 [Phenylobacterium sp.]|uniref:hypothetical protein n=1 Tax=Phenylobacterium sp. TaxID=1871053 RepID=UPI00391A9D5D
MSDISNRGPASLFRSLPREAVNIVGTAAAIFLTVLIGSAISSVLPENPSPWLFAGCYAAPGAVMFAVYWFIAQKL